MSRDDAPILVIGAGSIGTRHAQNLVALGADVSTADTDRDRAAAIIGARAVDLDRIDLSAFAGVVVASPTNLHAEHARASLAAGAYVLVEKPLAVDPAEAGSLAALGGPRLSVAYNLRYHEPVRRTVELALDGRAGRVRTTRLWFGSYLPDWRPHVDYRTSYSARRELGGGVLLDAIHELDLAVWLFGAGLTVLASVVRRVGPLDIDVEDVVAALLAAPSGALVDISLDYLSRRYRRGIEVIGDDATIRYDWSRRTLEVEDGSEVNVTTFDVPIERAYELEAAAFLDAVRRGGTAGVDGATAAESVRLAAAIRAATR